MSSDIFLFLSDEAFASVRTATVVKYADISKTGIGMLDDNLLNYFVDHSLFLDPLSDGNNSNRQSRCSVDDSSTGGIPNGRMMLHFDAAKILNSNSDSFSQELISGFVVKPNDDAAAAKMKRDRLGSLFNIIDTIFNARDAEAEPKQKDGIEALLTNAREASSTYLGYVAGSLELSTMKSKATTRLAQQGSPISEERYYWDSCSFDFKFVDIDNNVITITFHIWLNPDDFKENYPYSTIVDCIYPCQATWIMNPSLYANQTRAVLSSSNYKNEMLKNAVTSRDHNGVLIVSSRYISDFSDELPMGFAVLYKGGKPSATAAKEFIRSKLIDETDDYGNPWSIEEWRRRLPDLFIDGSYYLIPMYSQRVALPDSVTFVEKSCINYQKIFSIAKTVLGCLGWTDEYLMSNIEILQAPGHDLYIVGVAADPENQKTLSELHSTYSAVDALNQQFDGMDIGDQDFAEKLATAITLGLNYPADETTNSLYPESVIGNRPARSFAAGDIYNNTNMEYIILTYDKDDIIWG